MKTQSSKASLISRLALALASLGLLNAQAQFNSGSTGADGPLNVTTNTVLNLPPDGIFNRTTINVAAGATLRFNRNANNTPVYLLAEGDVTIAGTIDVSAQREELNSMPGRGGPGGFDGGAPGTPGVPAGAGRGPGGGPRDDCSGNAGGGAYGTSLRNLCGFGGSVYGNETLVPLVGGSGGGGVCMPHADGGGGGGGAILIASNTRLTLTDQGRILANGALPALNGDECGAGSGGGIRLVAPKVSGTGRLEAEGGRLFDAWGNFVRPYAGDGRVRIDTIDRRGLQLASTPA